jgi:uncharacterized protein YndB with AHSA1/START domain
MKNNSSTLEVSKQFDCSKEKLYQAWTEPEQLKQWWKPMGKQLTDVENNIEEGGIVRYSFEGNSLTIDGKYENVIEQELLEYSWNWHLEVEPIEDANYKLSVKFGGDEQQQSTLSITQQGFDKEESVQPHKQGWEQGLQQLYDYLSAKGSDSQSSLEGQQKPPITGYNETPEQQKVGGG